MNKIAKNIKIRNMKMSILHFFYSDKRFNEKTFLREFAREPNIDKPVTFSEKLLFLKMHYYNLLENSCVDKHNVTDYVKQCGYSEILKDVYQVCNKPEEIDLSLMPETFFIQCSHSQSYNYVVKKNDTKKIKEIKEIYKELLKRRQYKGFRENCYKFIEPRIICSEYLEDPRRESLTDYKFYCFSGQAKYFMVSYGELHHNVKNHKFDMNWNSIDHYFKKKKVIDESDIKRPDNFDKMVEIVEKLSEPFPHVRVDLYNLDGRIVFGEMTFYSNGGFVHIDSKEMDKTIASWIDLEKYKESFVDSTR